MPVNPVLTRCSALSRSKGPPAAGSEGAVLRARVNEVTEVCALAECVTSAPVSDPTWAFSASCATVHSGCCDALAVEVCPLPHVDSAQPASCRQPLYLTCPVTAQRSTPQVANPKLLRSRAANWISDAAAVMTPEQVGVALWLQGRSSFKLVFHCLRWFQFSSSMYTLAEPQSRPSPCRPSATGYGSEPDAHQTAP